MMHRPPVLTGRDAAFTLWEPRVRNLEPGGGTIFTRKPEGTERDDDDGPE